MFNEWVQSLSICVVLNVVLAQTDEYSSGTEYNVRTQPSNQNKFKFVFSSVGQVNYTAEQRRKNQLLFFPSIAEPTTTRDAQSLKIKDDASVLLRGPKLFPLPIFQHTWLILLVRTLHTVIGFAKCLFFVFFFCIMVCIVLLAFAWPRTIHIRVSAGNYLWVAHTGNCVLR